MSGIERKKEKAQKLESLGNTDFTSLKDMIILTRIRVNYNNLI
jgi:hypothetical protein